MKVIVAGSRTITDYEIVEEAINQSGFQIDIVISGGQVTRDKAGKPIGGVDWLGECWAEKYGIPIHVFPAKWELHGRKAGPLRNQEMVDRAHALIAIWDGQSRGTADIIKRAEAKGIPIFIFECKTHD